MITQTPPAPPVLRERGPQNNGWLDGPASHRHLRSASAMSSSIPPTNSLGLDFDAPQPAPPPPEAPAQDQPAREKKKPYVNPDRVKTGGPQRVCQTQPTLPLVLISPLGKTD